jgi:hypothetical protein
LEYWTDGRMERWVRILECGSGNLDSPPQAGLADFGMTELRPLPRGLGQLLKINFAGGAKPHPYEDLITAQKSRGGV